MTSYTLQKTLHKRYFDFLQIGMTENDARVLSSVKEGVTGDILSGERTLEIHGKPTDRTLLDGEILLVDLNFSLKGEYSDIARVYFMGEPSQNQKNAYSSICTALTDGQKFLKEGASTSKILEVMNDSLKNSFDCYAADGYKLGKDELVDGEAFSCTGSYTLKDGDRIVLSTQVCIKNAFAMRIKCNYLITHDGFIRLDEIPLDIENYTIYRRI